MDKQCCVNVTSPKHTLDLSVPCDQIQHRPYAGHVCMLALSILLRISQRRLPNITVMIGQF